MRARKGKRATGGSSRDRGGRSKRLAPRSRELAKENLALRRRLQKQSGLVDFFCRIDLADIDRLPHEIARGMREVLKLDRARVFLLRADRVLALAGEAGSAPADAEAEGAPKWRMESLEAATGADWADGGGADPGPSGVAGARGYLSLPLVAPGKRAVGLLVGDTLAPRAFSQEELSLGRQFAACAAMAIENARLLAAARAKMAELESAYHAKSEFLNTMAHELRTPMNVIIGNTELLEAGYYGQLSEPARKALQVTQKNAQNLLAVVNEVLELARLEIGRLPLEVESFAVGELIEELRGSFAPLAQKKNIALECAAADLRVKQDRKKLKRILENLLANAVKYTDHGGVSVRAFEPGPGRVAFEVRDSGIGIRPDDLERIFEPFHVAESVDRVKYPGTGLGLSLVKRLVQTLQGEIRVTSEPGKGATFVVTLPAALAASA
jgi:signal transduction histidine kinase